MKLLSITLFLLSVNIVLSSEILVALDEGGKSSINVWSDTLEPADTVSTFVQCERKFEPGGVKFNTGSDSRFLFTAREGLNNQLYGYGQLPVGQLSSVGEWCGMVDGFTAYDSSEEGSTELLDIVENGDIIAYTNGDFVRALINTTTPLDAHNKTIGPTGYDGVGPVYGASTMVPYVDQVMIYYRTGVFNQRGSYHSIKYIPDPPDGFLWRDLGIEFFFVLPVNLDLIDAAKVTSCSLRDYTFGLFYTGFEYRVYDINYFEVHHVTNQTVKGIKAGYDCNYYLYTDEAVIELQAPIYNNPEQKLIRTEHTILDIEPLPDMLIPSPEGEPYPSSPPLSSPPSSINELTPITVYSTQTVCDGDLDNLDLPEVDFTPDNYELLNVTYSDELPDFELGFNCELTVTEIYLVTGSVVSSLITTNVSQVVTHIITVINLGTFTLIAPNLNKECGGNGMTPLVYPVVDACDSGCAVWDVNVQTDVRNNSVVYSAVNPCGETVVAHASINLVDTDPPVIDPIEPDQGECTIPQARVEDLCDGVWFENPTSTEVDTCGVVWYWDICDASGNCADATLTTSF